MKRFQTYVYISGFLILTASCDKTIHEYPVSEESVIQVELNVDRTPPLYYKELTYDDKGGYTETVLDHDMAENYTPNERLCMRLVTELYRMKSPEDKINKGELIARRETAVDRLMEAPQDTLQFRVSEGIYRTLTWADYTVSGDTQDWHFDTPSLDAIRVDVEHKPKDNHHKSSAAGNCSFLIDFNKREDEKTIIIERTREKPVEGNIIPVYLERASGRFRLWATDLQDFLNGGNRIENLRIKIIYKQYVSIGYNVDTKAPNLFTQMRTMETVPSTVPGDGTVLLAYDYVLTSGDKEDNILVDVFVYDGTKELNHYQNIIIPLRRNMETVVKGPFLTKKVGSGNIGIDDDFDNEHVVVIPD